MPKDDTTQTQVPDDSQAADAGNAAGVEDKPQDQTPEQKAAIEEVGNVVHDIFSLGDADAEERAKDRKKSSSEKKEIAAAADADKKPDGEGAKPKDDDSKPAPKTPKKAKAKPEQPPTDFDPVEFAERMGKSVAQTIGETIAKGGKKDSKAPEPDKSAGVELTPKQIKTLDTLKEMKASSPERYANIERDYVDSIKAGEVYRQQWMKDNPGKRFNSSDEEHQDFFESITPDYDPDDYTEAQIRIHNKPMAELAKRAEKLEAELREMREKEEAATQEPLIRREMNTAAVRALEAINPDLLKAFGSPEGIEAAKKADPFGFKIAVNYANASGMMVATGARILDSKGRGVKWDDPQIQSFVAIKNQIETEIKAAAPEDQRDNRGRRFATWDEYARIQKEHPDLADRYWFLDKDMIRKIVPAKIAEIARAELTEYEESVRARTNSTSKTEANGKHDANADDEKTTDETKGKSPSSMAGRTQVSTEKKEGGGEGPEWQRKMLGIFGGQA